MSSLKKSEAEDLLREHNLLPTTHRKSVLKVFLNKKKVLSLQDISKTLGKEFDRITLYRTLASFEENGLIHKIPDNEGNISYALCQHETIDHLHMENHVHFKCSNCDLTICLEKIKIPSIKLPRKFKSVKHSFLIEGICERCN